MDSDLGGKSTKTKGDCLTVFHAPVPGAFVAHPQHSMLGIVALTAVRAGEESPQVGALAIIIVRDCERGSTAARNEKHRKWFV